MVRTGILQAVIAKHDHPRELEAATADSHLDEDSDGLEGMLWPELTAETVLPQLFGSPAEQQALRCPAGHGVLRTIRTRAQGWFEVAADVDQFA